MGKLLIRYMPAWVILIIGVLLTALVVAYTAANKDELAKSQFNNTADKLTDIIANSMNNSMRAMHHLASYYQGNNQVNRKEFESYISGFITLYPEIVTMQWAPRISQSMRYAHEQQQSIYKQDYSITDEMGSGALRRAIRRDYYFPVTYAYPMKGNENSFGYNMTSHPVCKTMLEDSISANGIAVSSRIQQLQKKSNDYAVMMAIPVVAAGKVALSLDSPHLKGFLLGVVRIKPIMDETLRYSVMQQYLDLQISDDLDSGKRQWLYRYTGSSVLANPYIFSKRIAVANRQWSVDIKADSVSFGANTSAKIVGMSVIGLCFSLLLAAYVYLLRSNQQQANQISERLSLEITRRKQYEKMLVESNSKLETLSREDAVMNIANRRAFDEYLLSEWKRAQRSGFPLSLIIADIDNFKAFNDEYGHVVGDQCLSKVAAVFHNIANRPSDMAARYGGEEIAVILPETLETGALIVAEKIRKAVADLGIPHERSTTQSVVTISVGVTTIMNAARFSVDEIIRFADKALYQAKQKGKDQVAFVKPDNAKVVVLEQSFAPIVNI